MKKFPLFLCMLSLCYCCSCSRDKTLFTALEANYTGITFANKILENDSVNILDVENLYNGGGVGVGDFNNDGLQDIYFSGNMVANKLYLNKGNFKFNDITDVASVDGKGRFSRGVSVVDINNDGLLDIYVCASLSEEAEKRQNILYVNSGIDENGIPHFKDSAAEYGLADTSHSTMAAFFDYDNDGDVDMYLVVNVILKGSFPGFFKQISTNSESPNTDKLFRNDMNPDLRHPVFSDVSKEAGITIEGYGHGINITDINKDGWKDIYVTNDFISNNHLYINNRNGRFSDQAQSYFKHTSENSMGQDVVDINNDGLVDVIELDMRPEDNFRKKMMSNPIGYQRYQNNDAFGYQYQYVRNVIQLNQGPRRLENDSVGAPVFSDIGFYSGIAETDWSWTPLVADFDNDSDRDIIITNGFPKDVTDRDFGTYRSKAYQLAKKEDLLVQIPEVKISNYAYSNNADLTFKDVTKEWGLSVPTFSNGGVYADLDNDGDLDLVINNINDRALVYKNNGREAAANKHRYFQLVFKGDALNRNGLGAWVDIRYGKDKIQVYENTPYRGYLSSVQHFAHFGLGDVETLDSVLITWPDGRMQVLKNVPTDQRLEVDISNAVLRGSFAAFPIAATPLFTEITSDVNVNYIHKERDFVDFNIQKLLPHKFSEYGPGLAVGDVDGNGLDDIVSGGSFFFDTQVFLQQDNGDFRRKALQGKGDSLAGKNNEDLGVLLFDADLDADLDLYLASGGYEFEKNTAAYADRLFENDGKGNFSQNRSALPENFTSKSCVRAADFDMDGDLDLFIAGRVEPWHYPRPVSSFIYRNDSKNGKIIFTDVTATVASPLINVGLIADGIWTDFNNDGWLDLVLAGEWMPITFLKNSNGRFLDVTAATGINEKLGWWSSLAPGDYDNDGDIDYIAGNLGLNSYYKGSTPYPARVYGKDFNGDGSYDAIPTLFMPLSQEDKVLKAYPAQLRDELVKQIIGFRSKFQNYKSFATASIDELFTPGEMEGALKLEANYFSHSFIRNTGDGKFEISPLTSSAQFICINGMLTEDFDNDGNLDLLVTGNDFGTEVSVGRYDACNGLVLKGDGKGNFMPLSILESGWFIPGNGKSVVKLRNKEGKQLIVSGENRGPMKIYKTNKEHTTIQVEKDDVSVIIEFKNGGVQKREIYYGASFLSQSGRFLTINESMKEVNVINSYGTKRKLVVQAAR